MSPPGRGSNNNLKQETALFKEIESAVAQVNSLVETVRKGDIEFASLRTELRILYENVRDITALLRGADGKASILTRLALLEQQITNLQKDMKDDDEIKSANITGQWQMKTALVTGVIGLFAAIISVLFTLSK